MKAKSLLSVTVLAVAVHLAAAAHANELPVEATDGEVRPLEIVSHEPAIYLNQSVPIGNGQLGASIYGGVDRERLLLNEVTLWSGEPSDWNNPGAKAALPEIRRLLFAGKTKDAEQLCRRLQGPYTQAYLPMGNLDIRFEHGVKSSNATNSVDASQKYSRVLDLRTAIANVNYSFGDVSYRREFFASYPDHVIAVRLTASAPGRMNFLARMDSLLRYRTLVEGRTFILHGKAPRHAEPNYENVDPAIRYADDESGPGMIFECHLRAVVQGGKTWTDHDGVHVQDADEAVLLLSAATSFAGYDKSPSRDGMDPGPVAAARLDAAGKLTFDQLRAGHLEDYQKLFNRVDLHLAGGKPKAATPDAKTADPTTRDPAPAAANDRWRGGFGPPEHSGVPADAALGYQFSRYRMIAASRPGGQPVTLCAGMWNDSVRPPWSFNYTLNETLERAYSGVEIANLGECAEPFVEFMKGLAANGRKTATVNYGMPGWMAHHNSDLWRQSGSVGRYGQGDPVWACFMLGGVWLCENLYNHYSFNADLEFLRATGYPILKGAAEFALAWLVEDPASGWLVTAPSTSPENWYLLPDGQRASVTIGSAADTSLIWELFKNTIGASRVLGVDADLRQQLEQAQARLAPLKIGSKGQLLEWHDEYRETDPQHRHASLLVGLAWGSRITRRETPEWFAAARKSLELRGNGATLPSKVSMCARLEDGELCYRNLDTSLNMAELFVQSHAGEIHLLPALPLAWSDGWVRGLKARGGYGVDVEWRAGRFLTGVIRAKSDGTCRVRVGGPVTVRSADHPVIFTKPEDNVVEFAGRAGQTYTLHAGPNPR